MTQQFDLSMFIPGITYADTESMTAIERTAMYKMLVEYLKKKYSKN